MSEKILHIGDSISGGGAGTVLRDTFTILKKYDHINSHSLMVRKSGFYSSLVNFKFKDESSNSIINSLSQVYSFKNYNSLKKILNDLNPSVIHLQSFGNLSPSVLSAIYVYKKKNATLKVFQTVHTFEYICAHYAGYDYKKKIKCTDCSSNAYKRKIFTRKCSRLGGFHSWAKGITSMIYTYYVNKNVIDHIMTPSNFLKKKMLDHPKINIISVLRNPVGFVDGKNKLIDFNKINNFNFVYFGRFSEEKNLECLVRAFHLISKKYSFFNLIMIGEGDKKKDLESLVNDLGITDKVKFTGFLSKNKLLEALNECHVSVLTSKCYETASMVVLESVESNLIPIVCNHGGMKEMVETIDFGLVFNNGFEELADTMGNSFSNYNDLLTAMNKSKVLVRKFFSEKVFFEQLNNIYKKY